MAVGDSVVGGQARVHDRAREDLPLRDPRPLDERAEPDDRDLRREDDAEDALDAALADARDGDRRLRHLRAPQRAGPRAGDEVAERVHQLLDRELVGVVDRRRDEAAATKGDRDADVDVVAADELVSAPDRVQLRHLAQRERNGLDHEDAVQHPLRDGAAQVLLAEPRERPAHVDRLPEVEVRDLALRPAHRGGDRPAHGGIALRGRRERGARGGARRGGAAATGGGVGAAAAGGGRGCGLLRRRLAGRGGSLDVATLDATAGARALEPLDLDPELVPELPGGRRDQQMVLGGRGPRAGARCRGARCGLLGRRAAGQAPRAQEPREPAPRLPRGSRRAGSRPAPRSRARPAPGR